MQFGLFGSATARRPNPGEAAEFDSSEGFRDFIEYNVEAEALGFRSTFVVEHHFTGYGQVSATINLLTWMGAGGERSVRQVAERGYNLLLGQYASPADVGRSIAAYKSAVEAQGRRFDPLQVGVTRAFFVCDTAEEKETALQRRLANRVRQLKLATRPDGSVHGGPDRATGDPDAVNRNSAIYGSPDEIAEKLDELRRVGVGYVLINGGGSGGGERGRASLRRFAREVMPSFADEPARARAAE